MPITVNIPTPLRAFTDKLDTVELEGATVGELLQALTTRFGGLKQHLYSPDGRLRSFVNVYVNDDDIRYLQKEQTPVKAGDSVSIVPSVAGGTASVESVSSVASAAEPSTSSAARSSASSVLDGEEIKRY